MTCVGGIGRAYKLLTSSQYGVTLVVSPLLGECMHKLGAKICILKRMSSIDEEPSVVVRVVLALGTYITIETSRLRQLKLAVGSLASDTPEQEKKQVYSFKNGCIMMMLISADHTRSVFACC